MDEKARGTRIRETIDALIHTMRLHHRIVEKRIDGLGVHHSQHRMLMQLSRMGRSASQKDIADAMDVSPACVARTLKQLSAAGLVEKSEGADGRCNEIALLPRGRQAVSDSIAVFREIDSQMFEGFSGAELAALGTMLERLRDNLAEMEGREPEGDRVEGSVCAR